MMKKIEDYILETEKMPNISDGGSPAYLFGDYVLVKYSNKSKYGNARPNEELTAQAVNKLNKKVLIHHAI